MGSCKTNRRTGPVGPPSDLSRSFCDGVVMVFRSCCDGVPVSRPRSDGVGHAVMVSRSCCDGVPATFGVPVML